MRGLLDFQIRNLKCSDTSSQSVCQACQCKHLLRSFWLLHTSALNSPPFSFKGIPCKFSNYPVLPEMMKLAHCPVSGTLISITCLCASNPAFPRRTDSIDFIVELDDFQHYKNSHLILSNHFPSKKQMQ